MNVGTAGKEVTSVVRCLSSRSGVFARQEPTNTVRHHVSVPDISVYWLTVRQHELPTQRTGFGSALDAQPLTPTHPPNPTPTVSHRNLSAPYVLHRGVRTTIRQDVKQMDTWRGILVNTSRPTNTTQRRQRVSSSSGREGYDPIILRRAGNNVINIIPNSWCFLVETNPEMIACIRTNKCEQVCHTTTNMIKVASQT